MSTIYFLSYGLNIQFFAPIVTEKCMDIPVKIFRFLDKGSIVAQSKIQALKMLIMMF